MKKFFFLSAGLVLSIAGFSQLSFGLEGTANLANASIKSEYDVSFSKKSNVLPGAGIVAQYDLGRHWSVRSGVNFLQNGVTASTILDESANLKVKMENKLNYVQVPVNLIYGIPVAGFRLYGGAGPYANYGISGTSKGTVSYTMPDENESVEVEKVKAFKKEEEGGAGFKRFDWGVGAIAGIQLPNGIFANLGYQLSLSNSQKSDAGGKYKNRGLQLTVGYFF